MRYLPTLLLVALAAPVNAAESYIHSSGPANPPIGWVQFCKDPLPCTPSQGHNQFSLKGIEKVNSFVNQSVEPVEDLGYYNRDEAWVIPKKFGDCEDYVLLKRKILIEWGVPASLLLIAVVVNENGDGNAVLLLRFQGGDFVLDNLTDKVKPWYETSYRFIKRQSSEDPNRWVSLDGLSGTQNTAAQ